MAPIDSITMDITHPGLRTQTLLASLAITAGILLLAVLPIGMTIGLRSDLAWWTFDAHIVMHALTVLIAIALPLRLARLSGFEGFVIFILIVAFLAAPTLLGFMPVTSKDALIHHLAVPKWWNESGEISQIPWHEWSYYPMLLNLAFTFLLNSGSAVACSLYHLTYLIIFAGILSSCLWWYTDNPRTALFSYLITVSLPICIRLAGTPMVDLGLALYSGIAVVSVLCWAHLSFSKKHLLLAGAALGLGLDTKYNGVLFTILFLVSFVIVAKRSKAPHKTILSGVIILGGVSFILFFPWLLKNALWINNPFYPMMRGVFGPHEGSLGLPSLRPLEHRIVLYGESWFDIISMPIRMILLGKDENPRFYDGVLSPLILCAFIPFFWVRKKPQVLFLALISTLYFIFAIVLSSARVRYMAPIFLPILMLTSLGLHEAEKYPKRWGTLFVYATVTLHLTFALFYTARVMNEDDVFPYLLSNSTEDMYLTKHIPEYPMIQYVNHNVPPDQYTYLLYTGNQFYYFTGRILSGGYFSGNKILRWLRSTGSAKMLATELKTRGISYLMVHTERTVSTFPTLLRTDNERKVWIDFSTNYLERVHDSGAFSLWHVKD